MAADGLRYLSQGPLAANLHLNHACAAARLGDLDTARQAVGLAHAAREGDYRDDLVEIGGEEFSLSRATTYAKGGRALVDTGANGHEAAAELEGAISLYDQNADPAEQHWFGGKALAGTDLAVVRLRSGALDAAVAALAPVLALPPAQRVATLTTRLVQVRDELAAPVFRGLATGPRPERPDRGVRPRGRHRRAALPVRMIRLLMLLRRKPSPHADDGLLLMACQPGSPLLPSWSARYLAEAVPGPQRLRGLSVPW